MLTKAIRISVSIPLMGISKICYPVTIQSYRKHKNAQERGEKITSNPNRNHITGLQNLCYIQVLVCGRALFVDTITSTQKGTSDNESGGKIDGTTGYVRAPYYAFV